MTVDQEADDELSASRRLVLDQREANEQLVRVAIESQEQREEAHAAQLRAEANERELREHAEFRELFIAILGHDLRNPLASITMTVSGLLDGNTLDATDRVRVARIQRSASRMDAMIEQLLDLTRARLGGGLPLTFVDADLAAIAHQVVDEFAGRPVRLVVDGAVAGTWDADRLAEMLSNIVGNGLDHAAPGTAVAIDLHRDGIDAVIAISNEGAPIPAEVMPAIFQPFRGGRAGTTRKSGHLGLGLFIAHEIVVGHGGTITASSAGGTTTFVVRLPLLH